MKSGFLIGFFLLFLLSSCEKYKDSSRFALLSTNQRLAKDWKLVSQSENTRASDLTGFDVHLIISPDQTYSFSTNYTHFGEVIKTEKRGKWQFVSSSKTLLLSELGGIKVERFTVLVLKKGEMQLQQNSPSSHTVKSITTKLYQFTTK